MGIWSRTWYGTGVGGSYIFQSPWGYKGAERTRQNLNALGSLRHQSALTVGGSRSDRHEINPAAVFDHPDYWDAVIDWTDITAGMTVIARVEVITANVTCSVKATIRNTTDGINIDGATIATTTYTEDIIVIPVPGAIGVKRYRLRLTPGLADIGINAVGVIEIYG